MKTVELFESLRRAHEFEGKSIRELAEEFHIHRRTIREALESAIPTPRKRPERTQPKLGLVRGFIDAILEADQKAPRKQRHTAQRIFQRIGEELQVKISDSRVRQYVRQRREALGIKVGDVYVPQEYRPGEFGEADWYEAYAVLGGERRLVQVFALRLCYSGDALHMAFPRATQQAFLQALEAAFNYFPGVPHTVKFDNLKAAVQKILRGRQRVETTRFVAFRSHWRFDAHFCNPSRGNEKGGVEGEVGRFRRNHFVPLPAVANFAELNEYLQAACYRDRERRVSGQSETVGQRRAAEQERLLPLADAFGLEEGSDPWVDSKSRVTIRTNHYSVPVRYAGRQVAARVSAQYVTLYYDGQEIARHERCYDRQQERLQLDHYLELLLRKPGALAGARPLAQMRAEGSWPDSYDQMWMGLKARYGESEGTRHMVRLLMLAREKGIEALRGGIEDALAWGCYDASAVQLLITRREDGRAAAPALEVGTLVIYDRPGPDMRRYDQLLWGGEEGTVQ